jgi:uncharacterized protein YjbJ (UPF0337 family)
MPAGETQRGVGGMKQALGKATGTLRAEGCADNLSGSANETADATKDATRQAGSSPGHLSQVDA